MCHLISLCGWSIVKSCSQQIINIGPQIEGPTEGRPDAHIVPHPAVPPSCHTCFNKAVKHFTPTKWSGRPAQASQEPSPPHLQILSATAETVSDNVLALLEFRVTCSSRCLAKLWGSHLYRPSSSKGPGPIRAKELIVKPSTSYQLSRQIISRLQCHWVLDISSNNSRGLPRVPGRGPGFLHR